MTSKTKDQIKAFFELGDKPTQSQFVDLIDSYLDKSGPLGALEVAGSALSTGVVIMTAGVPSVPSVATFTGNLTFATTAQANAGSDQSTVMSPVLVKNAISSQGTSQTVLLGAAAASTSSSLDFTSLISTAYRQYFIVISNLLTSTTSSINFAASTDNGSTFSLSMSSQKRAITLGGTTAPTYTGVNATTPALLTTSSTASKHNGIINISYGGTNGLWLVESSINNFDDVLAYKTFISPTNSTTMNAIRLLPSAGTFTSGTAYLYGIKNT